LEPEIQGEISMWQEITVGFIVAACLLYIGRRFWKRFKAAKSGNLDCSGGCKECSEICEKPTDHKTDVQ